MQFITVNTGSSGNGYILKASDGDSLIIEAGCPLKKVKEAIDFDMNGLDNLIFSHLHLDHSKYLKEYFNAGINCYTGISTFNEYTGKHHRLKAMEFQKFYKIGSFKVACFPVVHDVSNVCYLIKHEESGPILFVTDTHYIPYTFSGLSQIILEVNYSIDIVDQHLLEGNGNYIVRNRVLNSHMELETAKEFLRRTGTGSTVNIALIHLSESNSDQFLFQKEIEGLTGKNVCVASPGLNINFDRTPF
ncbi:MAG: hypothetical protein K9H26_18425 [Prolixibacteraceae bacterium]|nr:hypothetical protein [Prolixibacteraceae bacterium]